MFILMLFIKVILGLFIIALILVFITSIFLLMTVGKAGKAATQSSSGSHQDDDEPEMVNHPDHYNRPGQKECIVEMEEKFGPAAVQYLPVEPLQILISLRHERRCHPGHI